MKRLDRNETAEVKMKRLDRNITSVSLGKRGPFSSGEKPFHPPGLDSTYSKPRTKRSVLLTKLFLSRLFFQKYFSILYFYNHKKENRNPEYTFGNSFVKEILNKTFYTSSLVFSFMFVFPKVF